MGGDQVTECLQGEQLTTHGIEEKWEGHTLQNCWGRTFLSYSRLTVATLTEGMDDREEERGAHSLGSNLASAVAMRQEVSVCKYNVKPSHTI